MQTRLHGPHPDAQHLRHLAAGQVQGVIKVEQKLVVIGKPLDLVAQVDATREISLTRLALHRLREPQHGPPSLAAGHSTLVGDDRKKPGPSRAQVSRMRWRWRQPLSAIS